MLHLITSRASEFDLAMFLELFHQHTPLNSFFVSAIVSVSDLSSFVSAISPFSPLSSRTISSLRSLVVLSEIFPISPLSASLRSLRSLLFRLLFRRLCDLSDLSSFGSSFGVSAISPISPLSSRSLRSLLFRLVQIIEKTRQDQSGNVDSNEASLAPEQGVQLEIMGIFEKAVSAKRYTEWLGKCESNQARISTICEMVKKETKAKHYMLMDVMLDQLLQAISTSNEVQIIRAAVLVLSTR
ncbi:hypothetical protein Scep_016167 [Stephania cephalantha]|uniref:Putative E3 ubiquitin-protein ligase LIN ARM repeats domain-containing protein n=1 Tax=Stephania cephalantha TaxID=152367 RepID=A0AAP0NTX9_9MAGN